MDLLTSSTTSVLWHDVIRHAEDCCSITLQDELEAYLVALLIRFTNKPEVAKQILATAFLEALQRHQFERQLSLQQVGDQCLLFAGLFPRAAEKKHVKISYFVSVGRSAYSSISKKTNDLYGSLAVHFVPLMDVLQSIRAYPDLLPLEAYEQWNLLGSKRAFKILEQTTKGIPIKLPKT